MEDNFKQKDLSLEKLEEFFTYDIEVKKKLYQLGSIPTSHEELIEYTDILWKSTESIRSKLIKICKLFDINIAVPIVENLIKNCQQRIINTNYSYQDIQSIYNDLFAKMNEETISLIQENIFGYSDKTMEDFGLILNKCASCNEFLHALHSYVIRNESILQSIPEIKSIPIGTSKWVKISLRGDQNQLAEDIFDKLVEQNADVSSEARFHAVGNTDIVAINKSNKILIMARDKGHSLTIETKLEEDGNYGVEYYMPKSISYNLTSKLRGITNYNDGDDFAIGSFLTEPGCFVNDIVDLINSVPTDCNLSWTNETMYSYLNDQAYHR